MKEIEYWMGKKEIEGMYTSDYWNNIEEEKTKEWWIEDSKDKKVEQYLLRSGLKEEFDLALKNSEIKGKVLDLAAGTCWTSAELSKYDNVSEIDAVEFSYHRINDLAPKTIESLGGKKEKINRILGSFYDIKRDDETYDVVVLSQAYHHAQYPLKLFHECNRVLKKGGYILIIGEHIVDKKRIFRRLIKNILNRKFSFDIFKEFYNHNDPLGDHSYLLQDYKFTFYAYGYDYKLLSSGVRGSSIFIGKK
ncbi:MAG: class I SAM-dependent methyltransferase [Campylobacterales bacterium]|nr:class I SAM-dependent methyltransferase [Campylobacterales bacterium]